MAKAHSKIKTTITKTRTVKLRPKRSLTVGYSPNGGQTQPQTETDHKGALAGADGFYAGQAVLIKVKRNKLIIELAMQI